MLDFLALGLAWTVLYVFAKSAASPKLENVLSFIPATLFRLSLPPIFGLLSALLARPLPLHLSILHPLLSLSVFLFFQRLVSLNSPTSTIVSEFTKSSPFLRHYDSLLFTFTLLFSFLLLR